MSRPSELHRSQTSASFREVTASESAAQAAPVEARFPSFGIIGGPDASECVSRFGALRVGFVGAGGIGSSAIRMVARHRPASMLIVDPKRLKSASFITHDAPASAVGAPKAAFAGEAAKRISPGSRVRIFDGPVQALGVAAFADLDVVLGATDNLGAEVCIGQACVRLGIPLIQASLFSEGLVVQVRTFENRSGAGPCPACQFGDLEWDHVARDSEFRCSGAGERPEEIIRVQPTVSTPALGPAAASLALVQLTRLVLGLGQPVADTSVLYSGVSHRTIVAPLKRHPECPCEHRRFTRVLVRKDLAALTLRDLATAAGLNSSPLPPDLTFEFDGLTFVSATICCQSEPRPVERFFPPYAVIGRCPHCREPLHADGYFARRRVSARDLDPATALEAFGVGAARCVVLRTTDAAYLIHGKPSGGSE